MDPRTLLPAAERTRRGGEPTLAYALRLPAPPLELGVIPACTADLPAAHNM